MARDKLDFLGSSFDCCCCGHFPKGNRGKRLKDCLSEQEVLDLLEKVDKSDPQKRCRNFYDGRFEKLLPCLFLYGEALRIVDRYGYLTDTFFRVLADIGSDQRWQHRLCEVEANKFMPQNPYFAKYGNLLFGYIRRYDLLPEVKEELFQNPKYKRVVEIYEIARS